MKRLRRIIAVLAFFSGVTCFVLLLNIAAPNPTGRRYSSEMPLVTGQGSANDIGTDAERILATDLRLPSNNSSGQRQCICQNQSASVPSGCRVCIANLKFVNNSVSSRLPDFVAPTFLAESKNRQELLAAEADQLAQLTDYASAAKALGRQLWVFTRTNTQIDAQYYQIVESTGGDIIHYLTVPGYVDPVDETARTGFSVSVVVLGSVGLIEVVAIKRRRQQIQTRTEIHIPVEPVDLTPNAPGTSTKTSKEVGTLNRAQRIIDHTENFGKDSKARLRDQIDRLD